MNILLLRFREVILSILPIDVLVLHFTIAPLEGLVVSYMSDSSVKFYGNGRNNKYMRRHYKYLRRKL